MSTLLSKFLTDYSLDTLRDVNISSPLEENILVYDSTTQKFKNTAIPVFGKDAADKSKVASESTTGNQFAVYDTLNFTVSGTSTSNKYRFMANFLWGHDSAANDIRVRIVLDGTPIKEIRIEGKDAGTDQRVDGTLLKYIPNLTPGNHTLTLEYRPASASRVSRMYESDMEVWRTQ